VSIAREKGRDGLVTLFEVVRKSEPAGDFEFVFEKTT